MTSKNIFGPNKLSSRSESGGALLTVLFLLIAFEGILQISNYALRQTRSEVAKARVTSSRENLAQKLSNYGSQVGTIRASLDSSLLGKENFELQNCIYGTVAANCKGGQVLSPVALYFPMTDNGKVNLVLVSSANSQSPVLYDSHGHLCREKKYVLGQACPFAVTSQFQSVCPGSAASCSFAQTVKVHFKIESFFKAGSEHTQSFAVPASIVLANNVNRRDVFPATAGVATTATIIAAFGQVIEKTTYTSIPTTINSIEDFILVHGITDTTTIAAMYERVKIITDPLVAVGVLAGVYFDKNMKFMSQVDISKTQKVVDAINSSTTLAKCNGCDYWDYLYFSQVVADAQPAVADAIAKSGVTQYDIIYAIREASITDSTLIKTIYTNLETSGINQLPGGIDIYAPAIIKAGITDVPGMLKFVSSNPSLTADYRVTSSPGGGGTTSTTVKTFVPGTSTPSTPGTKSPTPVSVTLISTCSGSSGLCGISSF